MFHRILMACSILVLVTTAGASAAEAAISPATYEADRQRALQMALDDPHVQDRLALRPGMKHREILVDYSTSPNESERFLGNAWVIAWYLPGAPIDDPVFTVRADLELGLIEPSGQALVVMPKRNGDMLRQWRGPTWQWTILAAIFLACWLATFRRGDGMRMLAPIAVAAAVFLLTLANVVPRDIIRGGNIALFGATILALAAGAWIWMRRPLRPSEPLHPRGPWPLWALAWAGALAYLVAGVLRVKQPIDVALASDIGARLMQGGVPVYGNVEDVPGQLLHGDTYGPIAYFAYIPGVALTDDRAAAVLWTNVALVALVGVLLFVAGLRRGSTTRGLWAAAAWTSCPAVAIGAVIGNNDVVVAATLTLVLLLATRPAWRGAMVALAACTKFLPALIGIVVLRLRGESWRTSARYVAAGLVTLLIVFVVALRGIDALDEFWNNAVVFQIGRDDIASFWGLTQLSTARYMFLGAAIVVAFLAARRSSRHGMHVVAGSVAAVLALTIAALPQFWGAYVTWIVPPVLLAMLWRGGAPLDESDVPAAHAAASVTADDTEPDREPDLYS